MALQVVETKVERRIREIKARLEKIMAKPLGKWTAADQRYMWNRPIPVTDSISVDVIEREVVVCYEEQFEERPQLQLVK